MISTIALMVVCGAAAAAPVGESLGTALVRNAVTIEGTASLEVTADTCRARFTVGAKGSTAKEAGERLKGARKGFASAVGSVTGSAAEFEFGTVGISYGSGREGGGGVFLARQAAEFSTGSFPKTREEFNRYFEKITAAVAEARVAGDGVAEPEVVFEVTNPKVFEERLAAAAVEDAGRRSAVAAKALGRGLDSVRAAYFPSGVSAEGRFVPFTGGRTPVVSDELTVVITYTVRIAYALAL